MKVLVSGVVHRKGTAKASGNEYDFCVVKTLREVEPFLSDRMTVKGSGFVEVELPADASLVEKLKGRKFPLELDLLTDARPNRYGGLEVYCTGVSG